VVLYITRKLASPIALRRTNPKKKKTHAQSSAVDADVGGPGQRRYTCRQWEGAPAVERCPGGSNARRERRRSAGERVVGGRDGGWWARCWSLTVPVLIVLAGDRPECRQ